MATHFRLLDDGISQSGKNQEQLEFDLQDMLKLNKQTKKHQHLPRFAIQLSSNILNSQQPQNFENLLVLDLSHNRIDRLPENLKTLINLRTLHLNDNFLKDLDYEILSQLAQLESFIVRNNLLTAIKPLRNWSKHLRILDVSQNHLKQLPYQIGELTRLEQLYIAHNNFSSLPYQLMFLKQNLKLLQLDWVKYSVYPLNETINEPKILSAFFETLKEIFFSLSQHNIDEEQEGIQFSQLIMHSKYIRFAKEHQDNTVQLFNESSSSKSLSASPETTKPSLTQAQLDRDDISVKITKTREKTPRQKNNLHLAVLNEDLGVLRCLIKEDKYHRFLIIFFRLRQQIDQVDEKGHTPLSLAIMEEKYLAAKYILFSEANVKMGGGWFGSCLNIAISKLQYYLVRDLIKKGSSVSSVDIFQNDPMHYLFTVYGNNPHDAQMIVQLLLKHNCDPNHRNDKGFTPLHIAILRGVLPALQFAVDYNKTIKDDLYHKKFQFGMLTLKDKHSCLHLAVQTRTIGVVGLILEYFPEQIFLRNAHNLTPTDYLKDDFIIFKMLLSYQRLVYKRQFKDTNTITNPYIEFETIEYNSLQSEESVQFSRSPTDRQETSNLGSYLTIVTNPDQLSHRPRIQPNIQQQQFGTLTRYIPLSPNNIQLIEEQSKLLKDCKQITKQEKQELQQKSRKLKEIAYEFKQVIMQEKMVFVPQMQGTNTERYAQITLLKRIYHSLNSLITILELPQSELLDLQWTKFLQNQNQTCFQQSREEVDRSYEEVISQGTVRKDHPYSNAMIRFFTQQNRQIEGLFEEHLMRDVTTQYDKCLENLMLFSSFLSPHAGFGLQRMILQLNNPMENEQTNTINHYEFMQTKLHINSIQESNYHILNHKLFNKVFQGKTLYQKTKSTIKL